MACIIGVIQQKVDPGEWQAEKIEANVVSGDDALQTMSYFILKGGTVYVFHGLADQSQYAQYSSVFSKTMGGFRNLTDQSKINVKPQKLAVKTATQAGTAGAALKQFGTADADIEQRTIMNGMLSTQTIAAGTLIKTVTK